MELIDPLLQGFATALQPQNLLLMMLGCVIGLFVGAMPGLGSVNGVAILLPVTFLVPPTGAIIFLAAVYYGAMYGGAISSIMLGIPGASTAVATVFDGRPLAMQGKADFALVAAAGMGLGTGGVAPLHPLLVGRRFGSDVVASVMGVQGLIGLPLLASAPLVAGCKVAA